MANVLAEGVRIFPPHQNAPDFVLGTIIITPEDLIFWMKANQSLVTEFQNKEQVKLQLLRSKEGKLYLPVDTYKKDTEPSAPQPQPAPRETPKDDLPF